MARNKGTFVGRETTYYDNGDRAITDTYMLSDGTLVYHIYNITADNREHSHQVMDEYGRHLYAREICPRRWIELDRMEARRWLAALSEEEFERVLNVSDLNTLKYIAGMINNNKNNSSEKENVNQIVKIKK